MTIVRTWRGWTSISHADEYFEYLLKTGLHDYQRTPGNKGVQALRRIQNGRAEFATISYWASMNSIAGFAGVDTERAKFYPEDDKYLIDREILVSHYDLIFQAR